MAFLLKRCRASLIFANFRHPRPIQIDFGDLEVDRFRCTACGSPALQRTLMSVSLDIPELVEQCVRFLDSVSDLKSCALVSHAWVHPAQSILFRAPKLTGTVIQFHQRAPLESPARHPQCFPASNSLYPPAYSLSGAARERCGRGNLLFSIHTPRRYRNYAPPRYFAASVGCGSTAFESADYSSPKDGRLYPIDLSQLAVLSIQNQATVNWAEIAPVLRTIQTLDIAPMRRHTPIDLSLFPHLSLLRIIWDFRMPAMVLETLLTINPTSQLRRIIFPFSSDLPREEYRQLDFVLSSLVIPRLPVIELEMDGVQRESAADALMDVFPELYSRGILIWNERCTNWWAAFIRWTTSIGSWGANVGADFPSKICALIDD
ncbi:hypothetical protein B0H16DRAFT_1700857, partial [Mycena metata]